MRLVCIPHFWSLRMMKSYFAVCAALLLLLTACSRERKTATTANGSSAGQSTSKTRQKPPEQPTKEEAVAVLTRVFGTAVALADDSHPTALSIDFNGDDSQDLAVMVIVRKSAAEDSNSELSNWSVQDVRS